MWRHAMRYGAALGVVAIGLNHLDQLTAQSYSAIPTIGSLFVLNVVAAGVIAVALVAPVPSRHGRAVHLAAAVAGLGLAAGSLAGLALSLTTGLFGFREPGVRAAIDLAVALDVVTIALLSAYLATAWPGTAPASPGTSRGRPRATRRPSAPGH
jgi:hypothetical protein